MTPAARLSAAIEILSAIDVQRIPAANALKDWGTAHRFAGSGDRAAISGLVESGVRCVSVICVRRKTDMTCSFARARYDCQMSVRWLGGCLKQAICGPALSAPFP